MFVSQQEELFWQLYKCRNEQEVDKLIRQRPEVFGQPDNWLPLGSNKSNFSIVENQQSNPVAALTEKLTNAMDAILVRRCYEEGLDPESKAAPGSIEEAVTAFFPQYKNWDLQKQRKEQAESIQVLADGSVRDTSIVVYDAGEGQHPSQFEETFLSLLRGNKQKIKFVHGRYNMGGTGAIVFCGKRRYQLIASKRFTGDGPFGFTLIREHPLSPEEASEVKDTWYEYLKIDGAIPAFDIDEINLGLHRRNFRFGAIIKLYSYDLHGNRNFLLDLAPRINQFLYNPALPFTVKESEQRYKRRGGYVLSNYGLISLLDRSDYLEAHFSQVMRHRDIGKFKVTVFVFKATAADKTASKTKQAIRDSYFKNGMQVLFSIAGQVHGHYTSEFITRTLQFNLLKDYLLIHVDCTEMKYPFRRELFMASRDRLKQSKEAADLRKKLGDSLKKGKLKDIYKQRKDRLSHDSADDEDLLKQMGEDLPFNEDLQDLIKQTFELDAKGKKQKPKPPKPVCEPFEGKRYPSFFHIDIKMRGDTPVVQIPHGDSKTVQFESDVENQYFDRADDPGDLNILVTTYSPNDASGGDQKGTVNDISDLFSVIRQSPQDGKIRLVFEPTEDVQVGDEIEMRADLLSSAEPNDALSEMFWIMIGEPQPKKPAKPKPPPKEQKLGLPKLRRVFQQVVADKREALTWEKLDGEGITMDNSVIMHPLVNESDELEAIYINMDSSILKNYRTKKRNISEDESTAADRRYISRVYYHTLFLYAINKGKNYAVSQANGDEQVNDIELTDYLKDLFDSNYAEFLVNFESGAMILS